jgi:hypothetical protein
MKPQPESSTQEVLAGLIERVTYHNAENGFCVLRAKARGHRDVVTVVGHAATIAAGEWVTASGEWVNDRTHGQQFKARFLRTPTTKRRHYRFVKYATLFCRQSKKPMAKQSSTKKPQQSSIETIITTRADTHGDFSHNALLAQQLRLVFASGDNYELLTPTQIEGLAMIAHKLGNCPGRC